MTCIARSTSLWVLFEALWAMLASRFCNAVPQRTQEHLLPRCRNLAARVQAKASPDTEARKPRQFGLGDLLGPIGLTLGNKASQVSAACDRQLRSCECLPHPLAGGAFMLNVSVIDRSQGQQRRGTVYFIAVRSRQTMATHPPPTIKAYMR